MVVHPTLTDLQCKSFLDECALSNWNLDVSATLYAIVVVVTAFRLHLRAKAPKMWWWDDTFALFAMLSMSALVAGPSSGRYVT